MSVSVLEPAHAQLTPTRTELNLGPFPIDRYLQSNRHSDDPSDPNYSVKLFPACGLSTTVRDCVRWFLLDAPNSFVAQGIKGVRFQFGLGGGYFSTPFTNTGTIQTAWRSNLGQFMVDLQSYGLTSVSPSPALIDGWSGEAHRVCDGCMTYITTVQQTCTGAQTLAFYKWLPFGFDPNNNYYPDGLNINNAYSCAAPNPYFWGWSKFFDMIDALLSEIQGAGLSITNLDLQNEVSFRHTTVMARMIYDPITYTDVLSGVRWLLNNRGFDQWRATFSVHSDNVKDDPSFNCASVYQDGAMVMPASAAIAAFNAGPIGLPLNFAYTNNLYCGGSTTGMKWLLVQYTQPNTIDIHSHLCVIRQNPYWPYNDQCDSNTNVTATATTFYGNVYQMLLAHSLTNANVVFGETNHVSPQNCDDFTPALASQNVAGYKSSSLYWYKGSTTTMRPWFNMSNSCYVDPINPSAPLIYGYPTGPYRP